MATQASSASQNRTFGAWLAAMPGWKKALVGVALAAAVGGAILSLTAGNPPPPTGGAAAGNPAGANFVPGIGGESPTGSPQPQQEPASKGVFRLGFSFLAGFCIGSFIRSMLKVASIAIGFWLFMTFLLAWLGMVTVDWNAIQTVWDRFAANVESEWGDFQRFMTGSLPAVGLAALGLAAGLKRH